MHFAARMYYWLIVRLLQQEYIFYFLYFFIGKQRTMCVIALITLQRSVKNYGLWKQIGFMSKLAKSGCKDKRLSSSPPLNLPVWHIYSVFLLIIALISRNCPHVCIATLPNLTPTASSCSGPDESWSDSIVCAKAQGSACATVEIQIPFWRNNIHQVKP